MPRDIKTVVIAGITMAALILFFGTLSRAVFYAPDEELALPDDSIQTPAEEVADYELPSRLIIPSLEVDANIQHVGINRAGNMAVPSNYTDVGWYKLGTVPGYRGSAVIDGHVDNGFGLDAVFKHVEELSPGDLITVVTSEGEEIQFKVEEVAVYDVRDVPLERVFNNDDRARLNLITCTGEWNTTTKDYSKRVVVYAVLV